jgi:flavorubredoxin
MTEDYTAFKISENVYWVGAIDWELRDFHGYTTHHGSTYNAYLIMGEKPILVDTVKKEFYPEMMSRIRSIIDPKKIDYILSNHAEMDHSGGLPKAIADIEPEAVYASAMGVKALNEHFQLDFPITEVKNHGKLTLGDSNFTFIETRMIHWPDSMFSFYENEGILFSQDGFGIHLATSKLFADENDQTIVRNELAKYFANLLMPYSTFIDRKLAELHESSLGIKMIAPDHGPIWRRQEDIEMVQNLWHEWMDQKYYKNAVILYDTMWGSTKQMAHSIADGIMSLDVPVKILRMSETNRSDVVTEILEAGALLLGSPTINNQIFPSLADSLCYLKGLKPKKLIGQVFGSYGWSGEATRLLAQELEILNVEMIGKPISCKYIPTAETLTSCRELGLIIAKKLLDKNS